MPSTTSAVARRSRAGAEAIGFSRNGRARHAEAAQDLPARDEVQRGAGQVGGVQRGRAARRGSLLLAADEQIARDHEPDDDEPGLLRERRRRRGERGGHEPPPSPPQRAGVEEHRAEHEDRDEQLLPPGDVRHRLHVDGVHREQEPCERRGGERQPQARRERQHEDRGGRVEEQVDEVVAEGREATDGVVQRVREGRERPVLRRRSLPGPCPDWRGQDPRHAVERPDEGVVDHLDAVVVREPVPERVEVREHGGERDREAGQASLA